MVDFFHNEYFIGLLKIILSLNYILDRDEVLNYSPVNLALNLNFNMAARPRAPNFISDNVFDPDEVRKRHFTYSSLCNIGEQREWVAFCAQMRLIHNSVRCDPGTRIISDSWVSYTLITQPRNLHSCCG